MDTGRDKGDLAQNSKSNTNIARQQLKDCGVNRMLVTEDPFKREKVLLRTTPTVKKVQEHLWKYSSKGTNIE